MRRRLALALILLAAGCVDAGEGEGAAPPSDVSMDALDGIMESDGAEDGSPAPPPGALVLNEIVARPTGDGADWVELLVTSDGPVGPGSDGGPPGTKRQANQANTSPAKAARSMRAATTTKATTTPASAPRPILQSQRPPLSHANSASAPSTRLARTRTW